MKKNGIPILLLYTIPWAFLALYGDAVYGWAWQYVLIFICMAVLAWRGVKTGGILLTGNVLSLGISLLFVHMLGFSGMNDYFKPFGAFGWAAVLTGASWLVQWLAIKRQWLVLGLLTAVVGAFLAGAYWLQLSM